MASNRSPKKRKSYKRYEIEYTGDDGSIYTVPKGVTHLRFHPSVTHLEDNKFEDYKQLRGVVLNEGLQSIGLNAFRGCDNLQSVSLPSTVTHIGRGTFGSCGSLQEVVLNDGLTNIEKAFNRCNSLQSITFPSTLTEIVSTFEFCSSLREVEINEGLRKIGKYAFCWCSSLETVNLPSSVTEIGTNAFAYCSRLREVILNGLPEIESDAFYDCTSLERFVFPSISTRLKALIKTGHFEIENKISEISAIGWRDGELFIPAIRIQHEQQWVGRIMTNVKVDEVKLDKITTLTAYYELKEATTLFELALWKARIDQTGSDDINREACRIEVPGPVKDVILQYLG